MSPDVQDIAGGLPQPLTPEGFTGTKVSPDGRFLLVAGPEGIYGYPLAGSEPRRLPGLEPGETAGPWTSDRRAIYVSRTPGQTFEVRRMDLTTGARTPWLTSGLPDPTCALVYGGVLTPDGRAYAYDHVSRVDVLTPGSRTSIEEIAIPPRPFGGRKHGMTFLAGGNSVQCPMETPQRFSVPGPGRRSSGPGESPKLAIYGIPIPTAN